MCMNPVEAVTAAFGVGVVPCLSGVIVVSSFVSTSCLILFAFTPSSSPSPSLLRFSPFEALAFPLRPLEPVSTAEARTWDPQGTPIKVLCGNEPNRVLVTFPSSYPSCCSSSSRSRVGIWRSLLRCRTASESASAAGPGSRKGDGRKACVSVIPAESQVKDASPMLPSQCCLYIYFGQAKLPGL